jgi:hypothetical protein
VIIVMGGAMEVINSKLLSWASILDDKTREQALATAHTAQGPCGAMCAEPTLGHGTADLRRLA